MSSLTFLKVKFEEIDQDGDGFVTLSEVDLLVEQICKDIENVSDEVKNGIKAILMVIGDEDGDDKISLEEYLAAAEEIGAFVGAVEAASKENRVDEIVRQVINDLDEAAYEAEVLEAMFAAVDTDGDGFLGAGEVGTLVEKVLEGLSVSEEERGEVTRILMKASDANADGKISLEEFLTASEEFSSILTGAVSSAVEKLDRERLIAAFNAIDTNGNGTISIDEINVLVGNVTAGLPVTEDIKEAISKILMKVADENEDNQMSLDEFLNASDLIDAVLQGVIIGGLERQALTNAFNSIDVDGNGTISKDEIETLVKVVTFGLPIDENTRDQISKSLMLIGDENDDGVLSLEEFINASDLFDEFLVSIVAMGQDLLRIQMLAAAFNAIDTEGNGYISLKDIDKLIERVTQGLPVSEETKTKVAELLVQIADTDKDGKITLEEFSAIATTFDAILHEVIVSGHIALQVEDLTAAFKSLDTDNSGYITVNEIDTLVEKVTQDLPITPEGRAEVSKILVGIADENQDGKISLEEFISSAGIFDEYLENVIEAGQTLLKLEELTETFNQFDTDSDGYISVNEVEDLVKDMTEGLNVTEESRAEIVKVLMQIGDANQDGKISLEEFIASADQFDAFLNSVVMFGGLGKNLDAPSFGASEQ